MAPEQVEQAVILARGHQRDPLSLVRVRDPPVHLKARGELAERSLEPVAVVLGLERRQPERHPHEEHPVLGMGRVLVGGDDVGAALEQEARDGGDDPGAVRARDQQSRGVVGAARNVRRGVRHQWLTAAAASSDTSRSS